MNEDEARFVRIQIQKTSLLLLEGWQFLNKLKMEAMTRQEYEKRLEKIRKQVNELSNRADDIEKDLSRKGR